MDFLEGLYTHLIVQLIFLTMDGVIVRHDSVQSAEDCVVLLEELIQSNRKLSAENQKLREEHAKATKNQAEVLQRIEQRLAAWLIKLFLAEEIPPDDDEEMQEILPFQLHAE